MTIKRILNGHRLTGVHAGTVNLSLQHIRAVRACADAVNGLTWQQTARHCGSRREGDTGHRRVGEMINAGFLRRGKGDDRNRIYATTHGVMWTMGQGALEVLRVLAAADGAVRAHAGGTEPRRINRRGAETCVSRGFAMKVRPGVYEVTAAGRSALAMMEADDE